MCWACNTSDSALLSAVHSQRDREKQERSRESNQDEDLHPDKLDFDSTDHSGT